MAEILTFPQPLTVVRPQPCPIVEAGGGAASATSSLLGALRMIREGDSREAAGRMIDQADTLECLMIAARNTIALTGDQPRDRHLGLAIAAWLEANGGHVE
jgi:hypothetical protein